MTFSPASEVARVAGWYGKLPTVGDFASRRLEADFIDAWDRWLGEGLQAQRDSLGDAWLDAFLQSPSWRFLLSPGVLPDFDPRAALAGVVMPSVDRVGRYFPLTLAGAIGRVPAAAIEFEALLGWLDRLENTALEALQNDWSIDELEASLASLAAPARASIDAGEDPLAEARRALAEAVAGGGGFVETASLASRADLASVFAAALGPPVAAASAPRRELRGYAFWIADGRGSPQLLVSKGLPGRDAFARMFGRRGAAAAAPLLGPVEPVADPVAAFAPASVVSPGPFADPLPAAGAEAAADLLALFEGAATAPIEDPLAHAPPRDDILALFGATEHEYRHAAELEAPPGLPVDAERPVFADPLPAAAPVAGASHDDLLALFDKAEQSEPDDDAPDARTSARKSDILDLFGGEPADPGRGPAR